MTGIARLDPVLEAMTDAGLELQLHGEVTDPGCDIFEREARFIIDVLAPLCAHHPELRIVLEHVTSAAGVAFARQAGPRSAATITAHHLEVERSDLFRGGLRPHLYCRPVPKARADRDAVLDAALSGEPRDRGRLARQDPSEYLVIGEQALESHGHHRHTGEWTLMISPHLTGRSLCAGEWPSGFAPTPNRQPITSRSDFTRVGP